jgi:thiamine-monophosphate kinase
MMDISDGLVRDGTRLAVASNAVLDLNQADLDRLAESLRPASDLLLVDPMAWVLGGGEDHGLLATFPPDVQLPPGFTAIGSVQAPGINSGPGVTIAGHAAGTRGRDHFAE